MVSVALLLNPVASASDEHQQMFSPCSTTFSLESSPRLSPVKKQKLCKDEAIFIKGKPKGNVRYWPCEETNEKLDVEHQKYRIFPKGHIAEYCKHIPYNSEKKSFLVKTGREGFHVFQYTFRMPDSEKKHVVMWDYNIGLVRITPFFKALDYPKTSPAKMLGKNPGLKEICHSITGGALAAQGYWMPFEAARAVAATFCYNIRHVLTPIFGTDFPAQCIIPSACGYESMQIPKSIINKCTETAKDYGAFSRESPATGSPQTPPFTNPVKWPSGSARHKSSKRAESSSEYETDSDSSEAYLYKPCKAIAHRRHRVLHTPRSFPSEVIQLSSRPVTSSQFEDDSESSNASGCEGRAKRKRYWSGEDEANNSDDDLESLSPFKRREWSTIMTAESAAQELLRLQMEDASLGLQLRRASS